MTLGTLDQHYAPLPIFHVIISPKVLGRYEWNAFFKFCHIFEIYAPFPISHVWVHNNMYLKNLNSTSTSLLFTFWHNIKHSRGEGKCDCGAHCLWCIPDWPGQTNVMVEWYNKEYKPSLWVTILVFLYWLIFLYRGRGTGLRTQMSRWGCQSIWLCPQCSRERRDTPPSMSSQTTWHILIKR